MDKIENNLDKLKCNIECLRETTVNQSTILPLAKERDESLEREFLALAKELCNAKVTTYNLRLEKELTSAKLANSETELTIWTDRLANIKILTKQNEKRISEKQKELDHLVSEHERRMKVISNNFRTAPSAYVNENLQSETKALNIEVQGLQQDLRKIDESKNCLNNEFDTKINFKMTSYLDGDRNSVKDVMSSCKIKEELTKALSEEKDLKNKLQIRGPF